MKRISVKRGRQVWAALMAAGATLAPAHAQQQGEPQPQAAAPLGPPQLRDFQLTPQRRIVTQPTPQPVQQQPAQQPPAQRPAPAAQQPQQQQPVERRVQQPGPRPAERQVGPTTAAPAAGAPLPGATANPAPTALPPADTQPAAPQPLPPAPAPAASAPAPSEGLPFWVYGLAAALVALGGFAFWRRRQAAARRAYALPTPEIVSTPEPSPPRVPRPDPVPRPWLELDLVAERATADPDESVVEFELTIRNSGGSTASKILLQAKLICGTTEQDKEITDFHRKKPGEHRTLAIPDLPAGQELKIKGRVDIKREDLKALRVQERLLFIPLVAVNAFYGWSSGRTGQTSKSFLVGREKTDSTDRMAPFRLDLGPRVYRTVGQRPYKLERRV